MGAAGPGGKGGFSEINMTPLIDIVLVVLIIMMVNIPIQIEKMGVKLPSTEAPPPNPKDKPEQLVIALYEDGTMALNRRLMPDETTLKFEVGRRLRSMAKKRVFVDAFPTVKYARIVDMIDLSRASGASEVGLARMKETGPVMWTSTHPGSLPMGLHILSPKVVGAINEKTADAALQKIKPQLTGCYQQALGRQRDMTGSVTLRVAIGPQGEHLEEPTVSQTDGFEDDAMVECMEKVLPALTYDPLGGSDKTALVLYSLVLSPG